MVRNAEGSHGTHATLAHPTWSEILTYLKDKGHALSEIEMTSGVQAIVRTRDAQGKVTLSGGADPRREGEALGD